MPLHKKSERVEAGYLIAQVVSIVLLGLIARAAAGFRDVNDALAFYGVYHREPLNQLIHFFGVPCILWSMLIFWAHLPIPLMTNYVIIMPGIPQHPLSHAAVAAAGYLLFYLKIDPFGGLLYAPIIYVMYATAIQVTLRDQEAAAKKLDKVSWTGTGRVLRYALLLHILAWYVQIHPGHAIIEGANPAVMKSFGGALTSAPLFAFYEGLWLLGINKELQIQTHALVAEYTAKMCAAGSAMRVCTEIQ